MGGISPFIHAQSDCGATESGAIWFLFQVAIKTRHWFIVCRFPQCLQCSSWLTRPEQIYPHQQSLYLAFTVVLLYSLRHPTLVSEDEQCCSAENQKGFVTISSLFSFVINSGSYVCVLGWFVLFSCWALSEENKTNKKKHLPWQVRNILTFESTRAQLIY